MRELLPALGLWLLLTFAVVVPVHLAYRAYWLMWPGFDYCLQAYVGLEVVVVVIYLLCRYTLSQGSAWLYTK